jgi:hypothetical protein
MKTGGKVAIISLSLIAVGTALYFFVFKKTASDYRKMIMDLLDSSNKEYFAKFKDLTDNKMTDQELKDTYLVLYMVKYPNTNQKYKNDTAFNTRVEAISEKYNIFT